MNIHHHIDNRAELEQLISLYFDGETTAQEERELRLCLADCPWSSEIIDEARFTLGFFAAHSQLKRRNIKKLTSRFRMTAIAASVAVMLTLGIGLLWQSQQPKDMCVAYVNGKTINNEKEVLSLMQDDLHVMGNATQSLSEQLSSLGEAIEIDI